MPRLTVAGLQIQAGGPQPAAAPVDPYVRVSLPSADFSGQPDLAMLSKTFGALLAQRSKDNRERLQAEGTAFAQNEGARTSAAESAIADAVGDAKDPAERLRRTKLAIGKLIDSGVLPSAAASPVFQIGLSQAVARDLASKARNELMGRVSELTVVRDAKDNPVQPPDLDKVLGQAFDKYASSPSVRDNAFGRQAFGELRQRYSEEFAARVAEERAPALEREQARLAVGEVVNGSELGKGLAQIEATGTFTADDVAGIERMADDFFVNRHIRDVRPLLLEAFGLRVAEAADSDPGTALGLIDLARQVKVAGVPLGEDVASEAKLVDLEQRVQDRRLALQNRQLSRQDAVVGVVRDRLRGAGLAAIARARVDGSDPAAAAASAVEATTHDPAVAGFLSELGYTVPPPWLVGEVQAGLQETARAAEVSGNRSDPSSLRALQLAQVDGTDPEHLRAQWDAAFRQGTVSFQDYQAAVDRIDNVADVLNVRNGVPEYQVALAGIQADQRVADALAGPDRDSLRDAYANSLGELNGIVEKAAAGKTSTSEIVRAVTAAVSSPEARAVQDKFRAAVREADGRRLAAERGVQDAIAAFDVDKAKQLIAAGRGTTIGPERALELDQQVLARQNEVNRATLSPVVDDARQGFAALLKARLAAGIPAPGDPSVTVDLSDEQQARVMSEALGRFDAQSADVVRGALKDVGPESFGSTVRERLRPVVQALLEQLGGEKAPAKPPAEGAAPQAFQDVASEARKAVAAQDLSQGELVAAGGAGPSTAVARPAWLADDVHRAVDAVRAKEIPNLRGQYDAAEWDRAVERQHLEVLRQPEDRAADAYAALDGQRFVPAGGLLEGRVTVSADLVLSPYLESLNIGLRSSSFTGVDTRALASDGLEAHRAELERAFPGARFQLQPASGNKPAVLLIDREVDVRKAHVNPFVAALWRTEAGMNKDLADDGLRARLLRRLGLTEDDLPNLRRYQALAIRRNQ